MRILFTLFIYSNFVPNEVQPGASPAKVSMDATERGNKEDNTVRTFKLQGIGVPESPVPGSSWTRTLKSRPLQLNITNKSTNYRTNTYSVCGTWG